MPVSFIPPFNVFAATLPGTLAAKGFSAISAAVWSDAPQLSGFHHVPMGAQTVVD